MTRGREFDPESVTQLLPIAAGEMSDFIGEPDGMTTYVRYSDYKSLLAEYRLLQRAAVQELMKTLKTK